VTRAFFLLAFTLALGTTGCVHSLSSLQVRPDGPPIAAPSRLVATVEDIPVARWRDRDGRPGFYDQVLREVLLERLAARGVREVLAPGDAGPPPPLGLSLWAFGECKTGVFRSQVLPWGLVSLVTLGFVPNRAAHEYVIELRAIEHDAAPPGRVRISRRTYVVVCGRGCGDWRVTRTLHMEGLARAIDEALDEVLPPAEP
jgi:hypothetical protein